MAYNKIPKSKAELLKIKNGEALLSLYEKIVKEFKITDPFAFDMSVPSKVKIMRSLEGNLNIKTIKVTGWSLSFGNGSRGNAGLGNKGNLYETELTESLNEYIFGNYEDINIAHKDSVLNIVKHIPNDYYLSGVSLDGGLNQKRPLQISSNRIVVGTSSSWDIGSTVTDITLTVTNKKNKQQTKKIYLSLKYGSTVTLVNAGVGKYLKESEIKQGLIQNKEGQALLELLNIENSQLCSVFNNYTGTGSGKEVVNITSNLKSNNMFKEFIRSVIGYGYILVHKEGSKTHVLEITEQVLEDMLTIKNAEVQYPTNGSAKRVDVIIKMNGIDIKLVIRNKSGAVYPSHILADYKFK